MGGGGLTPEVSYGGASTGLCKLYHKLELTDLTLLLPHFDQPLDPNFHFCTSMQVNQLCPHKFAVKQGCT